MKLIRRPHLKLYEGFGNLSHITIMGHALTLSPSRREFFNEGFLHNSISLLKLFMTKPFNNATVYIEWQGKTYTKKTEVDGFFIFDIPAISPVEPGTHHVKVRLLSEDSNRIIDECETHITIPKTRQFTFISDIDDTFLISHSATIWKRMKVLLTKNAYSRKPFEGVVKHYQALQFAQTSPENPNPFFYVSSSEWNLYDFITDFINHNKLPDGVLLLNQLKTLSGILKTGKNNHGTKFARIVRILEAYPSQRFILLGDDSQRDAYIYNSITEHFPDLIHCVYIRCVEQSQDENILNELKAIESRNIPTCYFLNSAEAMEHSRNIGLIT